MKITNKLLAAYAEGKVTNTERLAVRRYLMQNLEKIQSVVQMMNKDFKSEPEQDLSEIHPPKMSQQEESQSQDRGVGAFMNHVCSCSASIFGHSSFKDRHTAGFDDAEEDACDMKCAEEARSDSESREENEALFSRMDSLLKELAEDDAPKAADAQNEDFRILPMTATAARDEVDNACVIRCEGYALRHFGIEIDDATLLRESKEKGWFCPQGIKLHRIGNLSGLHGLGVAHRYHCTVADIRQALRNQQVVIAVVSAELLLGKTDAENAQPNHAVVVTDAGEERVTIRDFATPKEEDTYDNALFCRAWDNSSHYLVLLHNSAQYVPCPIELSDIPLSDDLIELREAIAENAHDVWALNRMKEGWTYGEVRDDKNKRHPDLVPYNLLPESEKEYDREMAMNTIRLVRKLGWDLLKRKEK